MASHNLGRCSTSLHVLFGEGYRCNPRNPKFHENLVVASRVESDGDISALFLVDEEDASQQDTGGTEGWTDGFFNDVGARVQGGRLYQFRADPSAADGMSASTFPC